MDKSAFVIPTPPIGFPSTVSKLDLEKGSKSALVIERSIQPDRSNRSRVTGSTTSASVLTGTGTADSQHNLHPDVDEGDTDRT